jgi:hypothetical protein
MGLPTSTLLVSLLLLTAAEPTVKEEPPLYPLASVSTSAEATREEGKGYELSRPKGWDAMPGVAEMTRGENFKLRLDPPGVDIPSKAEDNTTLYSPFMFMKPCGRLRAVFRRTDQRAAILVFSATCGTDGGVDEGIKRYLDYSVPDNTASSPVYRIKEGEAFPLIQFHKCKILKEGEPVFFEAIRGWKWAFKRMYNFVAFFPTDEGPGGISKEAREKIIGEILEIARSMK